MNKKHMNKIIVFLIIIVMTLTVLVVIFNHLCPQKISGLKYRPYSVIKSTVKDRIVENLIIKFYSQNDKMENANKEFVKYITAKEGYDCHPNKNPNKDWRQPYECCFHLMLPEKLYAEKPTVIMFTSYDYDFDEALKKGYMKESKIDAEEKYKIEQNNLIVLLCKDRLSIGEISNYYFRKLLGEGTYQDYIDNPDFCMYRASSDAELEELNKSKRTQR